MFSEPGSWDGGSIELLCLFRSPSVPSASEVHAAVWTWPQLSGPFMSSKLEPSEQAMCDPKDLKATYGVASLPGQIGQAAFQTTFVEDSDGTWLYAGVPLGSLGRLLPVGAFPFGEAAVQNWEHVVYGWLYGLAEHLYRKFKFDRAIVGWLTTMEVDELSERRIPEVRSHGYIAASDDSLVYYPPNRTSALLE
jgi:hypothetical protein